MLSGGAAYHMTVMTQVLQKKTTISQTIVKYME